MNTRTPGCADAFGALDALGGSTVLDALGKSDALGTFADVGLLGAPLAGVASVDGEASSFLGVGAEPGADADGAAAEGAAALGTAFEATPALDATLRAFAAFFGDTE